MDKNNSQNKIEIKIITLGDPHVGKDSLIIKYLDNKFSNVYKSTIGFDVKNKIITLKDGTEAKLMIFDTPGQERFRSLAENYRKKADGILLVYDITDRSTFDNIGIWLDIITEKGENEFPIVLVGNKADLTEKRKVSYEEGKNFAADKGFHFYETNDKNDTNVNECFLDLAELVYEKKGKKLNQNSNKKLENVSSKEKNGCHLY